ncbi:MAG: tandem-95 repeat protein [Candidatus Endonucleobacter bathymodioli]|uniref:Tandem-95 repeat protein n=1 Tax=Candidatus Endonucleibacter bathymodioli TaxID=539814 RepID=A0AA90NTR4_9GAMM|nr:tandem-95 repeat protein [Candidatus Endonucleobacter bathymodioli]
MIIGHIVTELGSVEIVSQDGSIRIANAGDPVFAGEIVSNSADFPITIMLINGRSILVERQQELLLEEYLLREVDVNEREKSSRIDESVDGFSNNDGHDKEERPEDGVWLASQGVVERNTTPESEDFYQSRYNIYGIERSQFTEEPEYNTPAIPANNPPVIQSQSLIIKENVVSDGSITIGTIKVIDLDEDQSHVYAIAGGNSEGCFAINPATGAITVVGELDYENIESYNLRIKVTDNGIPPLTTFKTITINVADINEAPVANADVATSDENGSLIINVLANDGDVDSGDNTSSFILLSTDIVDVNGNIIIGMGEVSVSNNQVLFASGSDFDYLNGGDVVDLVIRYQMSDRGGLTSENFVSITVTGTNDQPVIDVITKSGAIEEGYSTASLATTGTLTFTELDSGDVVTISEINTSNTLSGGTFADLDASLKSALIDGFSVTSEGWSYSTTADLDFLKEGQTITLTYKVVATDDSGATNAESAEKEVTVTITGTNDQPGIDSITTMGALTEGDGTASLATTGTLTFTELDSGDVVTISEINTSNTLSGGTFADLDASLKSALIDGFSVTSEGWSYSTTADLDFLKEGQTITLTYKVVATDDSGATNAESAEKEVTVTITGTNDQPGIDSITTMGALTEGDGTASLATTGTLTFTELDSGDVVTISEINTSNTLSGGTFADLDASLKSALIDGFSVTSEGWSYSTTADLDFLKEGQTITLTYKVVATDDSGATNAESAEKEVTVTITGTNDQPGIDSITTMGALTEGDGTASLATTGTLTFTELDSGDVVTISEINTSNTLSGGTFADLDASLKSALIDGFSVTSEGWSYSTNADLDFLGKDQTITLTYKVVATDNSETANAESEEKEVTVTITGTNDIPVVLASITTNVDEDNTLILTQASLLANASDIDGDSLTASNVQVNGTDATVVDHGDGTFSVIPAENFNGQLSLTFDVSDGTETASSSIELTVNSVNDGPVAVDDTRSNEGLIGVMGANSDNGVVVSASGEVNNNYSAYKAVDGVNADLSNNINSWAASSSDGSAWYQIDLGEATTLYQYDLKAITNNEIGREPKDWEFQGSNDGITWTLIDSRAEVNNWGSSEIKTFKLDDPETFRYFRFDISANNGDLSFTGFDGFQLYTKEAVPEDDDTLILDVLGNDSDIEGDTLSISEVGDVVNSVGEVMATATIVQVDGRPQISITANDNADSLAQDEVQELTFTYTISDGNGGFDTAIASFNIVGSNDAPTLTVESTKIVDEDGNTAITFNTADIDGAVTTTATAEHGAVIVNDDGTISYEPDADYNGSDTITVTATDNNGAITIKTSSITVNDVNDAPVIALESTKSVDEDGTATVTFVTTDVDGTLTSTATAEYGTTVINDNGTISYTPNANYNGADTVTVTSIDDDGAVTIATSSITVNDINDAPTITVVDAVETQNHSLSLDGDGDMITFNDGLIDPNNFTINITINPSNLNTGEWQGFIGFQDATHRSPSMWVTPDKSGLHFDSYSADKSERVSAEIDNVFENGTATTVTWVKDGNEYRIHINGDPEPIYVVEAPDVLHVNDTYNIGGVDNNFNGSIDDVQIYNSALTPEEVTSVYNGEVTQADSLVFQLDFEGDTPFENLAGTDISYTTVGNPQIVEEGVRNIVEADEDIPTIVATAADVDGTFSLSESSAEFGTLSMDADGNIIYTPNENYYGSDTINIKVVDDDGATTVTKFNLAVNNVNDAPMITEDLTASVNEDNALILTQADLLANASDVEGDNLTALNVQLSGSDATLVNNGDGTYTVTPNENFFGELDLTFAISDGAINIPSSIALTVVSVNDAPIIGVSTKASFSHDAWVTSGAANIVNGEGLLVEDIDTSLGGMLYEASFNSSGGLRTNFDFHIDPEGRASDDVGDGMAVVFMDGSAVDASNFVLGGAGTGLGASGLSSDFLTIGLDAYKHQLVEIRGADDVLIQSIDVESFGGMSHETDSRGLQVEITTDGMLNISMSFDGGTTFETLVSNLDLESVGVVIPETVKLAYTAATGRAVANMSIANVTIESIDTSLAGAIVEDTSYIFVEQDLLANASDIEGDDLSVQNLVLLNPENGTVINNNDGTFTFTPAQDFNGTVQFSYDVSDGQDNTLAPNFSLQVHAVNDAPVISSDVQIVTTEDTPLVISEADLLVNASDAEGDELSITGVSASADTHGTVGLVQHKAIVLDGIDDFIEVSNIVPDLVGKNNITFKATFTTTSSDDAVNENVLFGMADATGDDNVIRIGISNGRVYLCADKGAERQAELVGSGLNDGQPHRLSVTMVDGQSPIVIVDGVTLDTSAFPSYPFEVNAGDLATIGGEYDGVNNITDNFDGSISGISISSGDNTLLNFATVNDNVLEDSSGNGHDGTFMGGTIAISDTNLEVKFTPDENYNGDASFEYTVSDGNGGLATGVATIAVSDINDSATISLESTKLVDEDGNVSITFSSADVDGTVVSTIATAVHGTVTVNNDGTISYAPDADFNGADTITVAVTDDDGAVTIATSSITVNGINDAPTLTLESTKTIDEDGTATVTFSAADVDGTLTTIAIAGHGTVTVNNDGTISYTPDVDFNGTDTITVTVTDDDGSAVIQTSVITINDVNDAPLIALESTKSVDEDGATTVTFTQTDRDGTIVSTTATAGHGTVVINDNGTISYTPDANYNGTDTITVTSTDDDNAVIVETSAITVNDINDAPTLTVESTKKVDEDGSTTITFASADIDGTVITTATAEHGTVTVNNDGTISYSPDANYSGADTIKVTATDDDDSSVVATSSITVDAVVDAPVVEFDQNLAFATDNFEAGANGWNSSTGASGIFGTGDMLGPIGSETISKDYAIPEGLDDVVINFTVHEINTWDNESFTVLINGEEYTSVLLAHAESEEKDVGTVVLVDSSGSVVGKVVHGSDGIVSGLGQRGNQEWSQSHEFTINVPIPDGYDTLTLGFKANLDSPVGDESWGLDNVILAASPTAFDILAAEDDANVDLNLSTILVDADGSEILQDVIISNVPDAITLSHGINNGDGTWTVSSDDISSLSITPDANFNGLVELNVTATSVEQSNAGSASTTETIRVYFSPINDVPTITAPVDASCDEDNTITLTQEDLLANAVDVDGDTLTALNVQGDNVTVVDNGDGTFSVTPNENLSGDFSLSFDVSDGMDTVSSTIELHVTAVADAPTLTVLSNTSETLVTFTDSNITGIGGSAKLAGWETDNPDGQMEANDDGVYGVEDGRGMVVELERDAGDASNIYQNVDVQAGDTVRLTFDLTARAGAAGDDSAVDVMFEGQVVETIVPDVDWKSYTYTFTATTDSPRVELAATSQDGYGAVLDVINVSELITDIFEDTAVAVKIDASLTDTDGSESLQSIQIVDLTEGVVLSDGVNSVTVGDEQTSVDILGWDTNNITILLPANFNGEYVVKVEVISVEANGSTSVSTAEQSFSITPVNDEPVISGPTIASVDEDNTIILTQTDLLANAIDVDGDTLVASNVQVDGTDAVVIANVDGTFSVTPNQDFNGKLDLTFDVSDGTTTVASTVDLTVNSVNDGPVALDDDGSVVGNLVLGGADELVINSGLSNTNGKSVVSLWVKTGYTYGSIFNMNAASGGHDRSITINGDGNLSMYTWESGTNFETVSTTGVNVADGEWHHVVYSLNGTSSQLYVDGNLAATGNLGASGFNWSDQMVLGREDFAGSIKDLKTFEGSGATSDEVQSLMAGDTPASLADNLLIEMDFSSDAPYEASGRTTTLVGSPDTVDEQIDITVQDIDVASFDVLANDSDLEGDTLSISSASDATDAAGNVLGAVTIVMVDGKEQVQFTPNAETKALDIGETLDARFTYIISDGNGGTDTATVIFKIIGGNEGPIISEGISANVDEDASITLTQADLLANATDADGDTLVASNVQIKGNDAEVVDNGDGTFTVTPNEDFNGDVNLTFDVSDGLETVSSTIDLTVNSVNDTPVITLESEKTVDEDGNVSVTLSVNDVDGTVASTTATAEHGTVTVNNDGTISYSPYADYNGADTITVKATDDDGTITTSTSAITVNSINDAPVIVTETNQGSETQVVALDPIANDYDVDSAGISYHGVESDVMLEGVVVGTAEISSGSKSYDLRLSDLNEVSQSNIHAGLKVDTNYVGGTISIGGTTYDKGLVMHAETGGISEVTYEVPDGATNFTSIIGIDDYTASGSVVFSVVVDGVTVYTSGTRTGSDAGVSIDIDISGANSITLQVDDIDGILSDHAAWGNPTFVGIMPTTTMQFIPNEHLQELQDGEVADLTINYTVVDTEGLVTAGEAHLNVVGANDAPIINVIDNTVIQGVSQTIALASDIDGAVSLSFATAQHGTVTMDVDGNIIYTSDAGYAGNDLLQLMVVDNDGVEFSQTVNLTVSTPPPNAGNLIDGVVDGIVYTTSSGLAGMTDGNGGFLFNDGDTITFSVGNIELGSISAEEALSGQTFLQDIAGVDRGDLNDHYLENMATFLQSIDSDEGDNIVITAEMHAKLENAEIDLHTASEEEVKALVESIGEEFVSEEYAMEHVQKMLEKYTDMQSDDFDKHTDDSISTATLGTSPIAGVNYITSSGLTGITNEYGLFSFNVGDEITFSNAKGQEIASISAADIGSDKFITMQELLTHASDQQNQGNETSVLFIANEDREVSFTVEDLLTANNLDSQAIIDDVDCVIEEPLVEEMAVVSSAITGAEFDNADVLNGSAGSDLFSIDHDNVLVSGGGVADIFNFNALGSSGTPNNLSISDFSVDEGDVILLDDLIVNEDNRLDQLLDFAASPSETVINIRDIAGGDVTRTVTLDNVDLSVYGSTDAEIINKLLGDGSLQIDS